MLRNTKPVWECVESHKTEFFDLSDRIWGRPEENYQEFFAFSEHRQTLALQGFTVSEAVAGIATAVMGEAGKGGPVIAILGEYDACPV